MHSRTRCLWIGCCCLIWCFISGLQSGDTGFCPALLHPANGKVYPSECEVSTSSYSGMLCSFECDSGYVLSGSTKRLCLSSQQWTGSPTSCKRKIFVFFTNLCEPNIADLWLKHMLHCTVLSIYHYFDIGTEMVFKARSDCECYII